MTDKTGGSAFPQPDVYHPNGQIQYGGAGMNLRDYFAAKAMQALAEKHNSSAAAPGIAEWAYLIADEMIKAREVV